MPQSRALPGRSVSETRFPTGRTILRRDVALPTRSNYTFGQAAGIIRPRSSPLHTVGVVLLWLLVVVALLFIVITTVFGSKSDAMSGGSSQIRTTYRGKPGFDDFMSRITLYLGIGFMVLCLIVNVIFSRWPRP
ncbi:preprotein translocase subunit SecG [Fimbriimonadia bacterium ATM]|nr:MAG: preprotein translocase subunit SecG [Armatimonadota bacterium]MBC6968977.1 preprotein translocase subunit SecG [Armatimonadota bacterium]MCE7900106.1 preprotein translocase subunit SecG [Armatimonadetes bacterium ATM1]MDL1929409.1 preprotein translocase subunit SecG [Fimbriimonadia bacterium ATM]RIJ95205.1 MAG: preprotein translocase subunit SecG [Armatimonadota bacterium]